MAITSLNKILINQAKGLNVTFPLQTVATSSGTAAAAASGFFTPILASNALGTTYPGTIQTAPIPAGAVAEHLSSLLMCQSSGGVSRAFVLARIYLFGTLDLANAAAAPYDGFTHDAGTFPVQRTIMGTTQNVALQPYLYMTAVTATTAPAFILQTTSGPGNGYKNQAGTNVIGTKTFTLPSATTAAQSGYLLRLEDGDSAVTDITQISVTTKGTAGTATIYGIEPIQSLNTYSGPTALLDSFVAGLTAANINPAVPASGSVTSYLVIIGYATVATGATPLAWINTVLNS